MGKLKQMAQVLRKREKRTVARSVRGLKMTRGPGKAAGQRTWRQTRTGLTRIAKKRSTG